MPLQQLRVKSRKLVERPNAKRRHGPRELLGRGSLAGSALDRFTKERVFTLQKSVCLDIVWRKLIQNKMKDKKAVNPQS